MSNARDSSPPQLRDSHQTAHITPGVPKDSNVVSSSRRQRGGGDCRSGGRQRLTTVRTAGVGSHEYKPPEQGGADARSLRKVIEGIMHVWWRERREGPVDVE